MNVLALFQSTQKKSDSPFILNGWWAGVEGLALGFLRGNLAIKDNCQHCAKIVKQQQKFLAAWAAEAKKELSLFRNETERSGTNWNGRLE